MKIFPPNMIDFYKADHAAMYPEKTEQIYSNWTPRMSRVPGVDKVMVCQTEYFTEWLWEEWNENFFRLNKKDVLWKYKRRMDNALGKDAVDVARLGDLHDLGYLPIHIKALPEGTLCPLQVPMLTITNTDKRFYWLTNYLETILSCMLWQPMTNATMAFQFKKLLTEYARKTSDMPEFVQWQAHDFSMRGMAGLEAAVRSGASHLLSFYGTDTVGAIDFLEEYYQADSDKEIVGGSVYATEHSIMCMGGKETEKETYVRLLEKLYPKGIVSIVSDTWDYWKVITETLPEIKDLIMKRDGKLVIRPDSGDPVKVLCGDRESLGEECLYKGTIECLWDIFGGTTNSKGYKQLDPHIGAIYGDSINLERCRDILHRLEQKGFASTNVVFGVGSYTYQYNTRDTFGFAQKATWGKIDGKEVKLQKTPKTDAGFKHSAKGLLAVGPDLNLIQNVCPEQEADEIMGQLKTIFVDCALSARTPLSVIRKRVNEQLEKELL